MITAEQVLYNLHMQLHPSGECKRAFCSHRGAAAKLAPLVHDMIAEARKEAAEEIALAIEDLDRALGQHDEFYPGVFAAAAKAREIGRRS